MQEKYITKSRKPFFQLAVDLIKHGDRILDIGPGNSNFADLCGRDDIYFLEGNFQSAEILKKKFRNVDYGSLPALPYENSFFDLIHISHVVEHLSPEILYETLKEIDRCCAPGGVVVISAPLLSESFYDDLSHVKPYNPAVFLKYLCKGENYNLTREMISDQFTMEKLEYRLKERILFQGLKSSRSFFARYFYKFYSLLRKNSFKFYERTGFTLVLRKAIK